MLASAGTGVHEVGGTGVPTFAILVGGAVLLACAIAVLSLFLAVARGVLEQLGGLGPAPFLAVYGIAGTVAWFVTTAATGSTTTALVVALIGGLVVTVAVSWLVV